MSNIYFVHARKTIEAQALASQLAGYLSQGGEPVNHYAAAGGAILGLVSYDKLDKGIMPRYMRDHGLWGVLTGELYESDTLRNWTRTHPGCDCDDLSVLAAMYREGRLAEYLPNLNGAFFIVLWDPQARSLVAANDRYGLYPMYWSENSDAFCLSNRVLCCVLSGVSEGRFDVSGAALTLTLDDFVGERTLVSDVKAFPRATVLTRRANASTWKQYWEYTYNYESDGTSIQEFGDEIGRLLVRSVERQTQAHKHKRIGITLSGGLDSRSLAACAIRLGLPVETFTWGQNDCLDRRYAKQLAARLGLRHNDCEYEFMNITRDFEKGVRATDGMCNLTDMHMLLHLDHLREIHLVLNGYAGDAFLGGTFLRGEWMNLPVNADLASIVFAKRNTLLQESELQNALPGITELPVDRLPYAEYRRQFDSLGHLAPPDAIHRFIMENRQFRSTSLGTVLLRLSTESAACFFDYDLADLTLRIPVELRYKHRVYITMLLRTFPEASHVRWQATMLPPSAPESLVVFSKIIRRISRIFEPQMRKEAGNPSLPADFARWFRGPLRTWVEERIMDSGRVSEEVLHKEFGRRVWREHLAGNDHTRLLGRIITLQAFAGALEAARRGQVAANGKPVEVRD